MAQIGQNRGYLGYFIAGGVVASTGGALLAVGLIFTWLGYTFPDLMGEINGIPAPVSGVFITVGFGLTIGGIIPLVVGLALLGIGMSKKRRYKPIIAPAPSTKDTVPESPGFERVPEVAGMGRE